ncbi:hypothetical protein CORC01_07952 [Colletotrichum orchidophilum]|uniref:Uncharacterized protein n=1 Tax=Colletotrichum orchidophilum TaxID=1209926 RepID=A0A1G4B654_9PEZI|nr:uncharacterized protein CORC01_07952 [Colletotrichum orchidophilum]OHE96806.1 hypothetical protein CORC01_07952 [Colletotrichum orchidophilum]
MPVNEVWVKQQSQHSKWNLRAWTCQEAALSMRRSHFTGHFALLETGNGGESYIKGLPDPVCPTNGSIWDGLLLYRSYAIPYAAIYAKRELAFEADAFSA